MGFCVMNVDGIGCIGIILEFILQKTYMERAHC